MIYRNPLTKDEIIAGACLSVLVQYGISRGDNFVRFLL
jgi:hypothetical protein